MPGNHLICPLKQGLPFTIQTTALWMGWQKCCVGGCPAESPAQPCQLGCMAWTRHRVHWLLISPPAASGTMQILGNGTPRNNFFFSSSAFLVALLPQYPGRDSGWRSMPLPLCHHSCNAPCLHSSCCPAAACEGRGECEQGRHPVMLSGTFPQGSWQLGDRQQGHPMSGWAKDKHTDCCQECFPSCPTFFPHLNFATVLDGAILGLAFFTLEGHRPGGKCQDDGSCESGGADPAPSAPPD